MFEKNEARPPYFLLFIISLSKQIKYYLHACASLKICKFFSFVLQLISPHSMTAVCLSVNIYIYIYIYIFSLRQQPGSGQGLSMFMYLDHTQTHPVDSSERVTSPSQGPLPAQHTITTRRTSMLSAGFKPAIQAIMRP
jgi:hypothetical protein